MPNYRRWRQHGGTYFFTVNLLDRRSDLLVREIDQLRLVIQRVQEKHPFTIDAAVVLPDHLHMVWTLPVNDHNFSMRWRLIKGQFSRHQKGGQHALSQSRKRKNERGIWQRRFWEHLIRDQTDLNQHIDYIHYNPVKHKCARRAVDWPFSSLHRYISQGILPPTWGEFEPAAPIHAPLE